MQLASADRTFIKINGSAGLRSFYFTFNGISVFTHFYISPCPPCVIYDVIHFQNMNAIYFVGDTETKTI